MASGACGPDEWQPTGAVEVKSKGRMETYLWREEQLEQRCTASSAVASGFGVQHQSHRYAQLTQQNLIHTHRHATASLLISYITE